MGSKHPFQGSFVAPRNSCLKLGADYLARQNRERLLKRRVKELGRLGYEVTVRDLEAA